MGGQAQVVTFALDDLLARGEEVREVYVLHLSPADPRVRRALDQLADEFAGDRYGGRVCRFRPWVIRTRAGPPLVDIRDESDADQVWMEVYRLLGELKGQGRRLHLCIAGGRRIIGVLALSAAMPGLVGATLRRGGFLASLRPAITSASEPETASPKPGRVILKLFNLLGPELAPALLAEGIGLKEGQLKRFLEGLKGDFWESCLGAVWDGRPIEGPFLLPPIWPEKENEIRIKVTWID